MLTLITGTPGSGKSLHAVWEFARKVPGSTVEATNGEAVPRRLFTNIKNLIVEHQLIDAQNLETWHEWTQPGDVIIYDEVQEVWRPRALGQKVPDCIAALETHRHKGVDIILITQHPMLVDPNIRRLVNQHIHMRRLTKTVAYVYEWDHCANPGQYRTCINARVWFHPKAAYNMYKSAQLHTKPTARLPRLAIVGVLAVVAMAVLIPVTYGRMTERFSAPQAKKETAAPGNGLAALSTGKAPPSAGTPAPAAPPAPVRTQPELRPLGCISMAGRCECFDAEGVKVDVEREACEEGSHRVGYVLAHRLATVSPLRGALQPAALPPTLPSSGRRS